MKVLIVIDTILSKSMHLVKIIVIPYHNLQRGQLAHHILPVLRGIRVKNKSVNCHKKKKNHEKKLPGLLH